MNVDNTWAQHQEAFAEQTRADGAEAAILVTIFPGGRAEFHYTALPDVDPHQVAQRLHRLTQAVRHWKGEFGYWDTL